MAKTVKEHEAQTDALVAQLKSGDELLLKTKKELKAARDAFEKLRKFSHPCFEVRVGHDSVGKTIVAPMDRYIVDRINSISALLGDRPAEPSA